VGLNSLKSLNLTKLYPNNKNKNKNNKVKSKPLELRSRVKIIKLDLKNFVVNNCCRRRYSGIFYGDIPLMFSLCVLKTF
jgi:hypothetical protein